MKQLLSICLLPLLAWTSGSHASESSPYVKISGGYGLANNSVFSDSDCTAAYFGCTNSTTDNNPLGAYGEFDAGTVIELALGQRINPWFSVELALANRNNRDFSGYSNFNNLPVNEQFVKADLNSTSLMVNGLFDLADLLQLDNPSVSPYIGLGAGYARNKLGTSVYSFPTGTNHYQTDVPSGTTNSFAWNAGLGAIVKLEPQLELDLLVRYADLGKVASKAGDIQVYRKTSGNLTVPVGSIETSVATTELLVGLRWAF